MLRLALFLTTALVTLTIIAIVSTFDPAGTVPRIVGAAVVLVLITADVLYGRHQ